MEEDADKKYDLNYRKLLKIYKVSQKILVPNITIKISDKRFYLFWEF